MKVCNIHIIGRLFLLHWASWKCVAFDASSCLPVSLIHFPAPIQAMGLSHHICPWPTFHICNPSLFCHQQGVVSVQPFPGGNPCQFLSLCPTSCLLFLGHSRRSEGHIHASVELLRLFQLWLPPFRSCRAWEGPRKGKKNDCGGRLCRFLREADLSQAELRARRMSRSS